MFPRFKVKHFFINNIIKSVAIIILYIYYYENTSKKQTICVRVNMTYFHFNADFETVKHILNFYIT